MSDEQPSATMFMKNTLNKTKKSSLHHVMSLTHELDTYAYIYFMQNEYY